MTWRVAKSLLKLREQVNTMFPDREKENDGTIGDEAHASRSSDHNPWFSEGGVGIVTAMDITNDPDLQFSGISIRGSEGLCQALMRSKDPRIKYVISNRRIYSGTDQGHPPWEGRPYSGSNPHDHHVHVSVKSDKAHYDSEVPWNLGEVGTGAAPPPPVPAEQQVPFTLRKGSAGTYVIDLQRLLKMPPKEVDGDFGPHTEAAVRAFQTQQGLVSDGVVGPQTWKKLKGLT